MWLTDAELRELTERAYAKHQIAWLVANGYPFEVGANGHPKVLRAYVEQRAGLKTVKPRIGPRLDRLAKV